MIEKILLSTNFENLEANVEDQLFSGLFDNLSSFGKVFPNEDLVSLVDKIESMGADRFEAIHALDLMSLSHKVWGLSEFLSFPLNLSDLKEVSIELREAVYNYFRSEICMITIYSAIEQDLDIPNWLIQGLVTLAISGRTRSILKIWNIADKRNIVSTTELKNTIACTFIHSMDKKVYEDRAELTLARLELERVRCNQSR